MRWCSLLVLLGLTVASLQAQVFVPTGHMTRSRIEHSSTLLQDGRVLIAGGRAVNRFEATPTAEIYDPDTGAFAETGAMTSPRSGHTAVLLLDGRVLLMGGCGERCSSVEFYNPGTGTFTMTGNMSAEQRVNAAVLLRNGKVLVVGLLTIELFDPSSGTFVSLGKSQFTPLYDYWSTYSATLLADGTVLLICDRQASIYDPANNEFRDLPLQLNLTGSMVAPLLAGPIMFAGGYDPKSFYGNGALRQTVLYDPATQSFEVAAVMRQPRDFHTSTLLMDGRILLAGGYNGDGPDELIGVLGSAEMYDPATGTISQLGSNMVLHRTGHKATLLRDGRVLITGGQTALSNSRTVDDTRAEIFVPETTQGKVPLLSLDRRRYCVGDSWFLQADAAEPLAAIQISGTWDETPWTITNWTTSGQDGTLVATGTFGRDTVGNYEVWIHAGGKVSNSIFVKIQKCSGGDL